MTYFSNYLSPAKSLAAASFFLMEIGEGLNLFQGIYLVNLGWNEGAIGTAMSLMTFTALFAQTFSGDMVDKSTLDRRHLLSLASICTAASAMAILFVREGNVDHMLMYVTKAIEGIASSFIIPCLAALTMSSFGPDHFDSVISSNTFWGHIGRATSSTLAGVVSYILYPNIKYCFFVIGASALLGTIFVQSVSEGDRRLGRGLAVSHNTNIGNVSHSDSDEPLVGKNDTNFEMQSSSTLTNQNPVISSYESVIFDPRTVAICSTGFFLQFANANVMFVLGELMANDNKRGAIPLSAGAVLISQIIMAGTNVIVMKLTERGVGRKPLYLIGLMMIPTRCALIILLRNAGVKYLLLVQICDGLYGGFCGLVLPFILADITFGTGRFSVITGLTSTCLSVGNAMSTFIGQIIVEKYGHITSLTCSLVLSFLPIFIFTFFMPETINMRGTVPAVQTTQKQHGNTEYIEIA